MNFCTAKHEDSSDGCYRFENHEGDHSGRKGRDMSVFFWSDGPPPVPTVLVALSEEELKHLIKSVGSEAGEAQDGLRLKLYKAVVEVKGL